MTEALQYLYYTFDKFVAFVFNDMVIQSGVTFGWIVISVMLFSILIRNILNVPRSMGSFDKFREHTFVTNTVDSHGNRSWRESRTFRR